MLPKSIYVRLGVITIITGVLAGWMKYPELSKWLLGIGILSLIGKLFWGWYQDIRYVYVHDEEKFWQNLWGSIAFLQWIFLFYLVAGYMARHFLSFAWETNDEGDPENGLSYIASSIFFCLFFFARKHLRDAENRIQANKIIELESKLDEQRTNSNQWIQNQY